MIVDEETQRMCDLCLDDAPYHCACCGGDYCKQHMSHTHNCITCQAVLDAMPDPGWPTSYSNIAAEPLSSEPLKKELARLTKIVEGQ